MQSVNIRTAQNVTIRYEAASIGDRIVAFLLDGIIRVLYAMGVTEIFRQLQLELSTIVLFFILMPALLYYLWMEVFFNGQSLGKMALNMKVVMLDGSQPTLIAYLIRFIFRIIDVSLFTGGIAVITIMINGKGQRLGDIAGHTTVVKLQSNISVKRHELIKTMPETYQATFDQVVQLNDKDIAIILEALETYRNTANKKPVSAAEKRVKDILQIESDLPPVKFLYTIVRDYNYLTSGLV